MDTFVLQRSSPCPTAVDVVWADNTTGVVTRDETVTNATDPGPYAYSYETVFHLSQSRTPQRIGVHFTC